MVKAQYVECPLCFSLGQIKEDCKFCSGSNSVTKTVASKAKRELLLLEKQFALEEKEQREREIIEKEAEEKIIDEKTKIEKANIPKSITEEQILDFKSQVLAKAGNIKLKLEGKTVFPAKVLYYYSPNSNQTVPIMLPHLGNPLTIESTGEQYWLDRPAHFEGTLPVFKVMKGEVVSIEDEYNKERGKFCEKGHSAEDMKNKLKSMYLKRIFSFSSVNLMSIMGIILTNAVTGLLVWIVANAIK